MQQGLLKRIGAIGAVVAMAMLVSACLLSPGKFVSTLDIRKDGRFTYAYKGEIYLLALSKLAQDAEAAKEFTAEDCHEENGDVRKCTADELAEQKSNWEESRKASADKAKRDADQMKAMLGGIDPSSPQAAEELAARLRRQAGWRSVVHKGEGLFEVDFQLSGRLDHDFAFPTIERFPMANAFVQLSRRNDGTIRMDAPGFAPSGGNSPLTQMFQSGMMSDGKGDGAEGAEKGDMPRFPQLDGDFTLTTDGTILANNTDEGPQAIPAGQRLNWKVNPRTTAAPTALVRITQP